MAWIVRGRVEDQMVLTSHGRSTEFCVDPIEKKPLNHFLPGSAVLSFGTAGCNLACLREVVAPVRRPETGRARVGAQRGRSHVEHQRTPLRLSQRNDCRCAYL
jgi:hypothetical protein